MSQTLRNVIGRVPDLFADPMRFQRDMFGCFLRVFPALESARGDAEIIRRLVDSEAVFFESLEFEKTEIG